MRETRDPALHTYEQRCTDRERMLISTAVFGSMSVGMAISNIRGVNTTKRLNSISHGLALFFAVLSLMFIAAQGRKERGTVLILDPGPEVVRTLPMLVEKASVAMKNREDESKW